MRERMGRGLVRAQPWLLRNGDRSSRPLRRFRPVLRIGKAVVLTRHEDVRAVLERDDAFSVTYGEKMEQVTGPFILGWDDGPRYRAEAGALHAALRPGDLERLAALTREAAARALAAPASSRTPWRWPTRSPARASTRLFGLPEVASREQRDRARAVFRAVFLDGETPAVLEEGRRASAELVRGLEAAMRRVRDDGEAEETLLGRLLAAQSDGSGTALSDEAIPRNLVGLVAAWSASVPRAFSLAFDVLLTHPADLERAAAPRPPATRMPSPDAAARRAAAAAPGAVPGPRAAGARSSSRRAPPASTACGPATWSSRSRRRPCATATCSRPGRPAPRPARGEYLHFGAGCTAASGR